MREFSEEPVGLEGTKLVTEARQKNYGDPVENYETVATLASALFGWECDARQCMTFMILVKLVRDQEVPKRDNEVDICGYAHLLQYQREATERVVAFDPHPDVMQRLKEKTDVHADR